MYKYGIIVFTYLLKIFSLKVVFVNKLCALNVLLCCLGMSACTTFNPYNQPENLRFQKKTIDKTQLLHVKRDQKLCASDTADKQDCPIDFYIDDIKSGTFYINNSVNYHLKSESYNFKVKNCNADTCQSCDVDLNAEKLASREFTLSVDSEGKPFILNAGQPLACTTEKTAPILAAKETTIQVNLAADTLFKFDGSSLNDLLPKGRQEVVDLASKITSGYASVREIKLVGHTDRLGSDQYNQQLGQNRANTVRNLLVQNGVATNVVSATSAGEQQPVTDGCLTVKDREALKACLQPDRRVSVEITGITK
jgi:OmpA-OmpF porin, OOP family